MNKLDYTQIGGWPLELDDFEFEQNGLDDAFEGITGIFGVADDDGYILSGALQSGSPTVSVTAGFFVLNGEVFAVPAHTYEVAGGGETSFWQIQDTADPAGDEIFEDTVTRSTYRKREAIIITNSSPPGTFTPAIAPTVFDKLKETTALGIDDLEAEVDINTLDIADIDGPWSVYNIVAGDLEKTGTAEALTNEFGSINFLVIGRTLHYNMNIGGDVPSNSKTWDFSGIAAKLGVTLSGITQLNSAVVSATAGASLFAATAAWSAGAGLVINLETSGSDITSGVAIGMILSGSIQIG